MQQSQVVFPMYLRSPSPISPDRIQFTSIHQVNPSILHTSLEQRTSRDQLKLTQQLLPPLQCKTNAIGMSNGIGCCVRFSSRSLLFLSIRGAIDLAVQQQVENTLPYDGFNPAHEWFYGLTIQPLFPSTGWTQRTSASLRFDRYPWYLSQLYLPLLQA
jgi:hypothetical protein